VVGRCRAVTAHWFGGFCFRWFLLLQICLLAEERVNSEGCDWAPRVEGSQPVSTCLRREGDLGGIEVVESREAGDWCLD
jgi:hypothetical protein